MTHAVVLVKAERSALATLGPELAGLDGVAEVYSVTGEWDFVAMVRVSRDTSLSDLVTKRLSDVAGIASTHTMVAFEVYSRHDLEALFSIGE